MKEIIYIQAGNTSNYIGTHFWNTQESYFTYSDDSEPLIHHDISFREGRSDQNEATFCPRVLIFDHKSYFGPLSKYNELYPEVRDADQPFQRGLWNGPIAEHRHETISKSGYQQRLDRGEDDTEGDLENRSTTHMRFWSDFNRIYYIPRSIQKVPDLPDWEANRGDWNHGKSVFSKYDVDCGLNEESLRQFLEECNQAQGFQMSFDNSSFGGFSIGLLETIRDELPKIPVLAFPVLSGIDPSQVDVEEPSIRKLALQDTACIYALDELATQSVPIQAPSSWRLEKWSEQLTIDASNIYQSSAVLSAHIESATLPLRLKGRNEELSNLCTQLNWSQSTRISHLSGVLPFREDDDLDDVLYDFSAVVDTTPKENGQSLSQRTVLRGLTIDQARRVDTFFASRTGLAEPYLSSVHAPAYPLSSSFPNIFRPGGIHASNPTSRSLSSSSTTGRSLSLLSALRTTSSTYSIFQGYAALAQTCVARRYRALDAAGLEPDELREMVEKFAAMADAYTVEDNKEQEDDLGEDGDIE